MNEKAPSRMSTCSSRRLIWCGSMRRRKSSRLVNGSEDGPHLQDVPYGLGAEAADRGERHADAAACGACLGGAGDELDRVGIDDREPVGAAVDARRQDQHAPLACLLNRGAQAVVGGAAVVQDLGEEGRARWRDRA